MRTEDLEELLLEEEAFTFIWRRHDLPLFVVADVWHIWAVEEEVKVEDDREEMSNASELVGDGHDTIAIMARAIMTQLHDVVMVVRIPLIELMMMCTFVYDTMIVSARE
mmetsp:Transcript_12829/g.23097  ORF Transcript_12829/g.23097 Transcript_12829/m.23097 type:complete len:109 (+) Transcript_12829:1057-1383(+)